MWRGIPLRCCRSPSAQASVRPPFLPSPFFTFRLFRRSDFLLSHFSRFPLLRFPIFHFPTFPMNPPLLSTKRTFKCVAPLSAGIGSELITRLPCIASATQGHSSHVTRLNFSPHVTCHTSHVTQPNFAAKCVGGVEFEVE